MIVSTRTTADTRRTPQPKARPTFRRKAMCQLIALALSGGAAQAATPPPFSPAWFAAKQPGAAAPTSPAQAAGAGNNGGSAFTPGNVLLQQRVQQSIANLDAAAQAVAAQMSSQKSAQVAAQQLVSAVPNGLADGGLKVDRSVGTDPSLWQNANAPTQSVAAGHTNVEIRQTAAKAILSWESFNVGRDTTVHFDQTAGNLTDGSNAWIALNRINDPSGQPSSILGQIKAEGTVYLLNRNGVIFGGGAQVDTHSLIASSLDLFTHDVSKSNAFFLKNGIGATDDPENLLGNNGAVTAFLASGASEGYQEGARGDVVVEKGAMVSGTKDGFVILSAPKITQAGQVVADDGQVILSTAAGLTQRIGGNGLLDVAPQASLAATGVIENTGLIQARSGSVHWLADEAHQDGVVVASTSLSRPGSLVFDGSQDGSGTINFGKGSVTTVLPEKDGATTSSSKDADASFVTSSVQVNSIKATLEGGSLIEVPAGNVTFAHSGYLAAGSTIDVSGLANVMLPMSALLVTIPRIGLNELADSPLLRNSPLFSQKNVVIDSTQTGTRPDGLAWVGSPILNAAGYVTNVPRTIDQLMINAGNISFANSTIVRTGAQLRLEGGFINYLPGTIQTPRLQGSNGLLYDIASASPDVTYTGFAGVDSISHPRWGVTETYMSPLLAATGRFDPGFIKGGNAGTLSFALSAVESQSPDAPLIIDGDLSAHAYAGREQVRTGDLPLAGTLIIDAGDTAALTNFPLVTTQSAINFVIQNDRQPIESYVPDFSEEGGLPPPGGNPGDPNDPLWWRPLSTAMIDQGGFRKLKLSTSGTVLVRDDADLTLPDGGEVDISAGAVDVQGSIVTHGGAINLTSVGTGSTPALSDADTVSAFLRVGGHGLLDTSGRWINDAGRSADDQQGDAWINGGSVTLSTWQSILDRLNADATADINLDAGSVIDVSGGGYVDNTGRLSMAGALPAGRGGDVALETHVAPAAFNYSLSKQPDDLRGGAIALLGTLKAEGFSGGGNLTLHAPMIQIGGTPTPDENTSLLYLDPSFFASLGFSSYSLVADTDARVMPGASLVVAPRYMVADQTALTALASTTHLLDASTANVSTGSVDAFQAYAHHQDGDGISIQAGLYQDWINAANATGVTGTVDVGQGARVQVGAGDAITLKGAGHVVVDGALVAPGGDITLDNEALIRSVSPTRSLWLGPDARVDASGTVLPDPTARALPGAGSAPVQQRTGQLLAGGQVNLITDSDLVAERGAVINVDGASGTFDVPAPVRSGLAPTTYVASPVWSDAGSIVLGVGTGLFFDGSLDAHGGSVSARGGQLSLSVLPTPATSGDAQLVIAQSGWRAPDGGDPYDGMAPGLGDGGDIRFSADRLAGAGLDDLLLGTRLAMAPGQRSIDLVFAGDVNLQAARSIQINSDHLASIGADERVANGSDASTQGGHATLAAPYVSILGTQGSSPGAATGTGTLAVDANFIDIGGQVNLSGFANASFTSTGDLRFWLSGDESLFNDTGWLYSAGNMDFTATRVYPTSGYRFLIDASAPDAETTVAFHQAAATDTSTPLSAGGTLAVAADHIVQEGSLWVPSGAIALGTDDPAATLAALGLTSAVPLKTTQDVHLAPGSTTSVSLGGAVVPFGTTEDGKDWHYDNASAAGPDILTAPPAKSVSIAGGGVSIDAGARVDLSGGGYVQAVEWVPGTGGSRDVLAQYHTDYSNSQAGTQLPQYADGRPVYAIVPGYTAPVAARDAALENGAGAGPMVGQGVYLSGVPGLPDGVYTLLPARYATLPGALRVVQNTSVSDAVVGRTVTAPDGTSVVGGYFTDTLTGARDAIASSFMVQSAATWGQYSEYSVTSADTFFAAQAAGNGVASPRLGADAGRLVIAASDALSLGATLDATPGKGGRGSQVDIAGNAIQILGEGEPAADGYLHVAASELSALGAGSLLIGGTRASTAQGDQLSVIADNVLLSNDAAHPLAGSEIILVARGNGGITLGDGSVLRAVANGDAMAAPLLIGQNATDTTAAISGDGSFVRVSGQAAAAVVRRDVTGADGPAGEAPGQVSVGAGAVLDAAGALSMDTTGAMSVAPDATLHARYTDLTASRIELGDADASADANTLYLGPALLAQFAQNESTLLQARRTIGLSGGLSFAVPGALTLSTPSLVSNGGQVAISAGSFTLENASGAASGAPEAGQGALAIAAGTFDLGSGNLATQGLGTVAIQAPGGVVASGSGSVNFAGADVAIATPRVSASQGATNQWLTTGALNLVRGTGDTTTPAALAQGGQLDLQGGSLSVATDLVAHGGVFDLHATSGDLTLADGATVDVSGLSLPFNDVFVNTAGGTVSLSADAGSVLTGAGSKVDVHGGAKGGNAGTFNVAATNGSATLGGELAGSAQPGYLGGVVSVDTRGAFDLAALSRQAAAGGVDGSLSVHSRQGDLSLGTGDTLHAHLVHLTADGGDVAIAGSIDASGTFGGTIDLFGAGGVDIDGRLDTSASAAGHAGGDITIGTSGKGDGTLNAGAGYENVQAADAGHIRLGAQAQIIQTGDLGNGTLYLRAPLLAGGDVPVTLAPGLDLSHTGSTTVEAYATWDTRDAVTDPARHFDGTVDPAGWFAYDPATGKPTLVAGTFTDDAGNAIPDPDRANDAQVMDDLSRYRFTPDAINTDHASFYGYVGGDPAQGAGTLMQFVQQPGFTFEPRFAAVPDLHVRPGIELRNGDTAVNGGDISVLTNWNLGAGTQDADGTVHQVFRYGPGSEAPVVSFRAAHDLDVRASVSDAFFQFANAGGAGGAAPPPTTFDEASAYYQALKDTQLGFDAYPDIFPEPADPSMLAGGDPTAISDYYYEYVQYSKFLQTDLARDGFTGNIAGTAILYAVAYGFTTTVADAPVAPASANNLNEYVPYLAAYTKYFDATITLPELDWANSLSMPDTFKALEAPKTTLDAIDRSAPVDNSPSPVATVQNPLPLLSASLVGGQSTTYRFVAGADLGSSDPLALTRGTAGNVTLSGHTDFTDPATGQVIAAPTLIRTGTGSLAMVASGDIQWGDNRAPAAVYTAGAPADGTTSDHTAAILNPLTRDNVVAAATPELVISGAVNPDDGGDVLLHAEGNIVGQQNTVDTTGDITGTPGTRTTQYWWPWMQTANTSDRSSINFGAFDQGVMSVGGNVDVTAGGDIRQLAVSLPTTWTLAQDASGNTSLRTIGGGDLNVVAGGDILSGDYFVSRGNGTLHAGGAIGSDFTFTAPVGLAVQTLPVSTLIGMQDAQMDITAAGSVSVGGVFNPSWIDDPGVDALSPTGHADGQSYSTRSRLDITAYSGNLVYGDLAVPSALFAPTVQISSSASPTTAGDILPASVRLAAAAGDLDLLSAGELFPSADGNLSLLARDNVSFAMPAGQGGASRFVWGMIDAPLSSLPSPLYTDPLTALDGSPAAYVRQQGYLAASIGGGLSVQQFVHATTPWHATDDAPMRLYALEGDIVNGTGGGAGGVFLVPSTTAAVDAGRDIVDLAYVGQQLHGSDISTIRAGRDIYDTSLTGSLASVPGVDVPWSVLPVIVQGGSGYLDVEAGRNLGRLAAQTEFYALPATLQSAHYKLVSQAGTAAFMTGIDSIGNALNPSLAPGGASILASFGVAPGIDQAAFITAYVDPSTSRPPGLDDGSASLVAFVENYDAGLPVDTGRTSDRVVPTYSVDQAWARFQQLPDEAKAIFTEQTLYRILAQVGKDYNDDTSPFKGQYVRGYAAINTLFPASLGYTANGLDGGTNGAQQQVSTGDLDIRGSTIQTQRGGDVSLIGPGGEALLGGTSAPPPVADRVTGEFLDGPNTQGVLTLQSGNVSMFTDGSTLLAQSRVFTEQGGNVTIWSSNGDINAGKGAKTTSEIPPVSFLCSLDASCFENPAGQVSGAGIATLQTLPDAPEGSVYLLAPRGTVDAGDAGIRVSGNLVVAAAHVANADNVQVKGDSVGLPVVQSVNVGALNAASSAASAATKAAEDVVRQQQSDAHDKMPSIISVQVITSDTSASVTTPQNTGYDPSSPVQVMRRGSGGLTQEERARMQ